MTPQNPSIHARVAADALARLIADVRAGRAEWGHPHTARQTTDELIRILEELTATVQQMPADTVPARRTTGPARQPLDALNQAARSATEAAQQLRRARRHM